MASAFKRELKKKGWVWYIAYKDHAGQWCRSDTGLRVYSDDGKNRELRENKKEAQRRADAEQQRQNDIRDGRIEAPGTEATFEDMALRYIRLVGRRQRSAKDIEGRLKNWVFNAEVQLTARRTMRFGSMPVVAVRASHVLDVLDSASKKMTNHKILKRVPSMQLLKHIRGHISQVFEFAIADRACSQNPVKGTDASLYKPASKRPVKIPLEVALEIPKHVVVNWRNCFATALYAGMRKGELLALRPEDVNIERRHIYVGRSHEADRTKTDEDGYIGFPSVLTPYLQAQLSVARNGVLFPNPKGKQWSRHTDMASLMRSALKQMGIIESFDHKCRRKGCHHVENHKDDAQRSCPKCNFIMWPSAITPRGWTFKALRSTCASLIVERTGNLKAAQKQLRHKKIETTAKAYVDIGDEQQLNELEKTFAVFPVGFPGTSEASESSSEKPAKIVAMSGVTKRAIVDSNHWPSAPEADGPVFSRSSAFSQVSQNVVFAGALSEQVAPVVVRSEQVLPEVFPQGFPGPLKRVHSQASPMLGVGELSRRLGVHEQSVRKLIRTGELKAERHGAHFKVSEAEMLRFIGSTEPGDFLMRIPDVARHLRVPASEVWRLVSSEALPVVRIWSNTRVTQSAVRAFFSSSSSP